MNIRTIGLAIGACMLAGATTTPGMGQGGACGQALTYCTSTPNSTGMIADMAIHGSMSVTANDTMLEASNCPLGSWGIFVYGEAQVAYPFGNGILCVSPYAPGLFRLYPTMHATGPEPMLQALDFTAMPPGGEILGDSSWNFQFIYRDNAAAGARFNTSNAMHVTFCP